MAVGPIRLRCEKKIWLCGRGRMPGSFVVYGRDSASAGHCKGDSNLLFRYPGLLEVSDEIPPLHSLGYIEVHLGIRHYQIRTA